MAVKSKTDESLEELNLPRLMTYGDGGLIMLATEEDDGDLIGVCLRGNDDVYVGQKIGVKREALTTYTRSITLTNE